MQPEYNVGMKVIGEMSKEDLIDELIIGYRERMAEQSVKELKNNVISMRMDGIRNRLYNEAGFKPAQTILGGLIELPGEDDE